MQIIKVTHLGIICLETFTAIINLALARLLGVYIKEKGASIPLMAKPCLLVAMAGIITVTLMIVIDSISLFRVNKHPYLSTCILALNQFVFVLIAFNILLLLSYESLSFAEGW